MKPWLLLLLCLAIPLQGIASVRAWAERCTMAQPASLSAGADADAQFVAAAVPECCNDADGMALTGQLCKAAQDCSASVLALAPVAAAADDSALVAAVRSDTIGSGPAGHPSAVWRPPASR